MADRLISIDTDATVGVQLPEPVRTEMAEVILPSYLYTIPFAERGACDGVTDDRAAFAAALAELDAAGGGTLLLPPTDIAITMNAEATFDIPANTRILGTPGATRLLLTSTNDLVYVGLFGSAGDNVTIEGMTLLRNSDCTGFMFYPDGYDGFHVKNCVIDGNKVAYPTNVFHGWTMHRPTTLKRNITIRDCEITRLGYGLLYANTDAGDIDVTVVDNCWFHHNYSDDLEFNAPLTEWTNITVSRCQFTDHLGTSINACLGIGIAGCNGVVVRDCLFDGTYSDAIHLEWQAKNVLISNNRFIGCCNNTGVTITELDRASINIMARCYDVVVTGNIIDHRPNVNTNGLHAITVRNYTGGLSLLGETCDVPERITITDNIIHCGENFGGIWACDITDITVRGNRIFGDGTVSGGAWDDGNIRAGIMIDGRNTVIADNAVSGFRYGITGPIAEDSNGVGGISLDFNERRALGNPGVASGNMVSDCYIGMMAVSAGAVNINGNTMSNCVRPLVVGQREFPAEPCTATNNFADNCTYPLEVGGVMIVERPAGASAVAPGNVNVSVNDTPMTLPIGTVVTWASGASMRLLSAETTAQLYGAGPYNIYGTVYTGTSVAADDWGIITGLTHSSTAADNRVSAISNSDSTADVFHTDARDEPLAVGEATLPRFIGVNTNTVSLTNDVARFTYFTAQRTETISQVKTISGNTAAVGATLARIHIYEQDAHGNLTEVAKTANTTSLWTSTNTVYTTALEASFQKKAGHRYAVALCISGTSVAPTLFGYWPSDAAQFAESPRLSNYFATATLGSYYEFSVGFIASNKLFYTVLLP